MEFKTNLKRLIGTVYFQIILAFVIIIIPLHLGGLMLSNYGQALVMEQISLVALNKTEYFLNKINHGFDSIQNMEYECLYDIDFNKYALPETIENHYQEYAIYSRIKNRLFQVLSVMETTEHVSAYFYKTDSLISNPPLVAGKDVAESELLKDNKGYSGLQVIDGALYLLSAYPVLRMEGKETLFVVSAKLSNQKIAKSMLEVARTEKEYVLLLHESGWYLNASGMRLDDGECANIAEQLGGRESGVQQYQIGNEEYLMSWYSTEDYGLKMVTLSNMQKSLVYTNRFRLMLLIFSMIFFLVAIFFAVLIRRLVQKPMVTLVDAFTYMKNRDFKYRIAEKAPNEFSYIYENYNEMAGTINELVDTVYKAKILAQESEFKHLQAQINPHFLYNCFFLLNGQIQIGDQETASEMARKLGRYFKFITQSNQMRIPLENEYEYAITYSEIQMLRFGRRVRIECQPLPEQLRQIYVPRIIIQPLIENAFEHGVREREEGLIRLCAVEKDGILSIIVEDNGALENAQLIRLREYIAGNTDITGSTAVTNISKRLQLSYHEHAGLRAEPSDLGGLKMVIWIERGGADNV